MKLTPNQLRLLAVALLVGAWFGWHRSREASPVPAESPPDLGVRPPHRSGQPKVSLETSPETPVADPRKVEAYGSCYPNQVILRFHSSTDFEEFLHRPLPEGFGIAHQSPPLRALRLDYPNRESLEAFLVDQNLGLENLRATPAFEPIRQQSSSSLVGFGATAPEWLGLPQNRQDLGKGVRIAVLDTGVASHPQMRPPVESYDQLPGLTDFSAHGTSVASLITGQGPDIRGIAPAADLISIRVVNGTGISDTYAIATGIVQAVQARADLINLSLGQDENSLLLGDAVKFALDAGCFIVAAAGNQATNLPRFPAAYQGVISVGSVDSRRTRASFSNLGYGNGLSAPGAGINAAGESSSIISFSGTSASAPIVAASIAAIMSDGRQTRLSASEAVRLLYDLSDDEGDPGPDFEYGVGIVNPGRVLHRHVAGLTDGAITQVKWLPPADPSSLPSLRITIQNRGNTPLANPEVALRLPDAESILSSPPLLPGAIQSLEYKLPSSMAASPIPWEASLSYLGSSPDLTPANNRVRGVFSPAPR